jgi:hypothetical protein
VLRYLKIGALPVKEALEEWLFKGEVFSSWIQETDIGAGSISKLLQDVDMNLSFGMKQGDKVKIDRWSY